MLQKIVNSICHAMRNEGWYSLLQSNKLIGCAAIEEVHSLVLHVRAVKVVDVKNGWYLPSWKRSKGNCRMIEVLWGLVMFICITLFTATSSLSCIAIGLHRPLCTNCCFQVCSQGVMYPPSAVVSKKGTKESYQLCFASRGFDSFALMAASEKYPLMGLGGHWWIWIVWFYCCIHNDVILWHFYFVCNLR